MPPGPPGPNIRGPKPPGPNPPQPPRRWPVPSCDQANAATSTSRLTARPKTENRRPMINAPSNAREDRKNTDSNIAHVSLVAATFSVRFSCPQSSCRFLCVFAPLRDAVFVEPLSCAKPPHRYLRLARYSASAVRSSSLILPSNLGMRERSLTDVGSLMNFTSHSTVWSGFAPTLPRSGPRDIIPRNPPGPPGPGPPGPPGGGPPASGPPGGGPSGGGPPAPGPPGGPPGPPAICRPIEWQREQCVMNVVLAAANS